MHKPTLTVFCPDQKSSAVCHTRFHLPNHIRALRPGVECKRAVHINFLSFVNSQLLSLKATTVIAYLLEEIVVACMFEPLDMMRIFFDQLLDGGKSQIARDLINSV